MFNMISLSGEICRLKGLNAIITLVLIKPVTVSDYDSYEYWHFSLNLGFLCEKQTEDFVEPQNYFRKVMKS